MKDGGSFHNNKACMNHQGISALNIKYNNKKMASNVDSKASVVYNWTA